MEQQLQQAGEAYRGLQQRFSRLQNDRSQTAELAKVTADMAGMKAGLETLLGAVLPPDQANAARARLELDQIKAQLAQVQEQRGAPAPDPGAAYQPVVDPGTRRQLMAETLKTYYPDRDFSPEDPRIDWGYGADPYTASRRFHSSIAKIVEQDASTSAAAAATRETARELGATITDGSMPGTSPLAGQRDPSQIPDSEVMGPGVAKRKLTEAFALQESGQLDPGAIPMGPPRQRNYGAPKRWDNQ